MTLLLVDGSNLLWRSILSKASADMTRSDGTPTGAVVSFVRSLVDVAERYRVSKGAVVFDSRGPSFRKLLMPAYKGSREHDMPDGAKLQIPMMHDAVKCLGFTLVMSNPYEADDVIATLVARFSSNERVVVVSDDKDLGCLVSGTQVVQHRFCDARNGKPSPTLDEAAIRKKWLVPPRLISDVLALRGDSIDEVKGVTNIGPVYAAQALIRYKSAERFALAAADGKGKRWMQRAGAMTAINSMTSATRLVYDAQVDCDIRQRARDWPARIVSFLLELEAVSTAKRIARQNGMPFRATETRGKHSAGRSRLFR